MMDEFVDKLIVVDTDENIFVSDLATSYLTFCTINMVDPYPLSQLLEFIKAYFEIGVEYNLLSPLPYFRGIKLNFREPKTETT